MTYAGSYKSQRYTQLDQINKQNVSQLKPAWVYQLRAAGVFETSPLVVDGVMYMTEPPSTVTALDVRTGRPLWTWTPKIPDDVIVIGSPPVNRGVAVLDNMVYAGSIAGHLAALDAKTGALRWDVAVDDNKLGYYLTLAPLAIDGKIIVGVSGAENGIRGFVDAYDAKTGKRLWRRHTIPAPGEPGNETWGGKDSWKTGGGSTWLTGSYDPELKLLYWQTGNPGPDWNGDNRPGDNLYTCSVLALNPDDGTIKWHFQFTPHDTHDWDANETMVLFDAPVGGRPRKLLAQANRNGFYYVLDRATGEFVAGKSFVKQTWADGLDAKGRAIAKPGLEPSREGILVYPSIQGAANWHSPSYSPKTNLFYQTAVEMGTIFYKGEATYNPLHWFHGRGRAHAQHRRLIERHSCLGGDDRRLEMGVQAALGREEQLVVHRGRARVQRYGRRQLLRARRRDREAAVGHAARRKHPRDPDVVCRGRQAIRRDRRRLRAVRLRAAVVVPGTFRSG